MHGSTLGIVVDGLAAATAFFVELGLRLQGEGPVEGGWVDPVVGLEGVRAEIAMVKTTDGHGPLELTMFHAASGPGGDRHAPGEHAGYPPCRIRSRRHRRRRRQIASRRRGARWGGGRHEDSCRLCYVRGPEGITVDLAEQTG